MQGFSANLNQNKSIYLLQPLKKACKVILKIHFIRQCIRQLISMHIFEGDNIQLENSWSECTLENVYCEKASWKVAWCTEHFSLLQQLKCSETNATSREANNVLCLPQSSQGNNKWPRQIPEWQWHYWVEASTQHPVRVHSQYKAQALDTVANQRPRPS